MHVLDDSVKDSIFSGTGYLTTDIQYIDLRRPRNNTSRGCNSCLYIITAIVFVYNRILTLLCVSRLKWLLSALTT